MGMFDTITYKAPCPICGTTLTNWQSKDAGCSLDLLTPGELWEQRDRRSANKSVDFYDGCGKCGTWVQITLSSALLDMTKHDYEFVRRGIPLKRQRGPVIPGGDA